MLEFEFEVLPYDGCFGKYDNSRYSISCMKILVIHILLVVQYIFVGFIFSGAN